jgi:hypothetical protein
MLDREEGQSDALAKADDQSAGSGGFKPQAEPNLALNQPRAADESMKSGDAPIEADAVAGDQCVRLDQLIFVQVPAGQPVDDWIASVFRDANVHLDASDQANSFDDIVQRRENQRQQLGKDGQLESEALVGGDRQSRDAHTADSRQPELSPAPEYLRPDMSTTAYWVDAEVRQIRQIMDRLDEPFGCWA